MSRLCRQGIGYKKVGVVLSNLQRKTAVTGDLFAATKQERYQRLSAVLDQLNARWGGGGTIRSASILYPKTDWQTKRERLSRAYTTCSDELLTVA